MNKIKDKVPYPSDWKIKKLGELGSFLKGKGISKSETKESGLPCIRYGEIYTHHHNYIKEFYSFIDEETAKNSTKIRKGDILFAGSGETMEDIGKSVAFLDEGKAYAGGDIIILRTIDVNSQYLAYALNQGKLAKKRAKLGQGHSVVHIYPKDLKELIIHLPSDIEQEKISSILATWDKAIELKEKLIEQKKEQKKGLMQKLLTGEVRLPGFHERWKEVRLGSVLKERKETGFAHLELLAITSQKGVVKRTEVDIKDNSSEDKSKYKRILPNDIGYNTMRMWQGVSGVSKYEGIVSPAYTILTPTEKVNPEFIGYLFKHPKVVNLFKRYSQGLVSDTLNLKYENFKVIKIIMPLDIEEQKRISEILLCIDHEIEVLKREVESFISQKQGLMQLLLTGKVRVKV